jgi:hypothetical protein
MDANVPDAVVVDSYGTYIIETIKSSGETAQGIKKALEFLGMHKARGYGVGASDRLLSGFYQRY